MSLARADDRTNPWPERSRIEAVEGGGTGLVGRPPPGEGGEATIEAEEDEEVERRWTAFLPNVYVATY